MFGQQPILSGQESMSTLPGTYNNSFETNDNSVDSVDSVDSVERITRLLMVEIRIGLSLLQNLNKASLVKASGQTGTITITKTDWWTSDQVGSLIMLEPLDATVAFWTAGEVIGSGGVSVGEYRRYDEKIYQLTNATGTTVGTNPPIHDEGTAQADKVTAWTYVSDGKGIARIVSISASDAVATVLRTIPKSLSLIHI